MKPYRCGQEEEEPTGRRPHLCFPRASTPLRKPLKQSRRCTEKKPIRPSALPCVSLLTLILVSYSEVSFASARDSTIPSAVKLAFQHNNPMFHGKIKPSTPTTRSAYQTQIRLGLPRQISDALGFPKESLLFVNGQDRDNEEPLSTAKEASPKIPQHVGIICDGNSRWAKARGLPASLGHAAGANQLAKIVDSLQESGVVYCTFFAFSTENWKRPQHEIDDLLRIMEESCHRFYNRMMRGHIRVKVLGDLDDERIPSGFRSAFQKLERDTAENTAATNPETSERQPFTICFALNYGGRKDMLNASLKLAEMIADREVEPEDVDEELLSSLLCTREIPDPDLIIRTSGECRLSNFMLWNAAYAELYFTDELWPDFNHDSWQEALQWYSQRQRKFGGRHPVKHNNNRKGLPTTNGVL